MAMAMAAVRRRSGGHRRGVGGIRGEPRSRGYFRGELRGSKLHTELLRAAAAAFAARPPRRAADAADAWLGRQAARAARLLRRTADLEATDLRRRRPSRPRTTTVGSSSMTRRSRIKCDRGCRRPRRPTPAPTRRRPAAAAAERRRRRRHARRCGGRRGSSARWWIRCTSLWARAPASRAPRCRRAPAHVELDAGKFMRALEAALGPLPTDGGGAAGAGRCGTTARATPTATTPTAAAARATTTTTAAPRARRASTASSPRSWPNGRRAPAVAKGRRL